MIEKIISGGQTGVDRAALDAGIDINIHIGGWCPKGRLDENGIIPEKYSELTEVAGNFQTEQENYDLRTKLNIRDSEATLILLPSIPMPDNIKDGTLLTIQEVKRQDKPFYLLDLSANKITAVQECKDWIYKNSISVLNVAGPRESNCKGIYDLSYEFMIQILPDLQYNNGLNI